MKKSNSSSQHKIIGILVALLAVIVSASIFIVKHSNKKERLITVLSHNTKDMHTNPLEYRDQLEMLSQSKDLTLSTSAKQLLKVDDGFLNFLNRVQLKTLFHQPNIAHLIKAIAEEMGFETVNSKKIINRYLNEKRTMTLAQYFPLTINQFRHLDKALRIAGAQIPCLTFSYNEPFAKQIALFLEKEKTHPQHLNPDLESCFTKSWLQAIKPYLPAYYKSQTCTQEEFIQIVIDYYLFSRTIFTLIYLQDALQAYLAVAKHYNEIGMHKEANLLNLYIDKKPTFISLQETSHTFIQALHRQGYEMAQQDKANIKSHGVFGSVNLYAQSFIKKHGYTITKIPLDKQKVKQYSALEKLTHSNQKKLFTSQVAINKLENASHLIIHASFHADTAGTNSKPFLSTLFDQIDELKQQVKKPLYVVICMDGNFTTKGTAHKCDLRNVAQIISKAGYQIIDQEGENINTTKKMRSFLNVQYITKGGLLAEERNDLIIISNN
ncbi:MAG: hypothetical protein AAF380_03495, partial [Bacteroidota bacterium]